MDAHDTVGSSAAYQGSGDDIHEKHASSTSGDNYQGDHGAETALRRSLSTRHLTMIALGSSIGMGLWLGSGLSLANGGPAGIFLGYCLAGSMIWCVSHSIGEMACMYPLPSAFVQWTGKFVDPSAAFALGWSYWFSYCITISNELQAANTVINFWTSAVPVAGWISIWFVVIVLINVGAVTVFGEIEVIASTIKFCWIFVVIISMIVMSAGGAGYGPVGFRYWDEMAFTHGFKGFLSVMPTCIFAMSGSENSGLVAAETANPRKSIPRAVSSIWIRLSLFYLIGALMITINVSPANKDLFGQSGTNASPFVIAYRDAGLPALAHLMNVVILISVISTGSISGYGGSRTTMGLAHLNMAPKVMQRADRSGRPWWGLVPTFVLGGGLAYLNVSESGANVFTWFSSLTSLFTLFGWGMICLSHLRFRYAWAAQGHTPDELPWKSWIYPVGPWWGLIMCIILIIVQFYLAVWPLGESPSATNFFSVYVSVIVIIVLWLGARLWFCGSWWIDLDTINLDEGRRFYRNDVEKVEASGVKGMTKKAVGAIFN
ncbi:amino acid permease/ SLC12A domain-containing protein [Jackrogersella minutella]|nr:amino acid permease/ SLC12A domain-containing protein [Jackrogersella minutella]